jgi:uncharacterized RDD family membrane protein YckC
MEAIHPKYKTFWRRFAAGILDAIIISFPLIIIDFLFFYSTGDEERSVTKYLFSDDRVIDSASFTLTILHSFILIVYSVYFTGLRGGTLGKKAVGITVLSGDDETSYIGIKRAIIRDLPYIAIEIIGILFILLSLQGVDGVIDEDSPIPRILSNLASIWLLAELITMLGNERRRAIHDILANSVVVKQVHEEVVTQ